MHLCGRKQKLAEIIKSSKVAHRDYVVVDVRDDDWVGGNIKNSHKAPSAKFSSDVDSLVAKTKEVPVVVFHCALSQSRCVIDTMIWW